MMAKKGIEKWQAPVMETDPSRVIRNREEHEASIPTAKEIDQWRAQAEEEGYQQGQLRAQQQVQQLQQRLIQLIQQSIVLIMKDRILVLLLIVWSTL